MNMPAESRTAGNLIDLFGKMPAILIPSLIYVCFSFSLSGQPSKRQRAIDLRPIESLVEQGKLAEARAALEGALEQSRSDADAYNLLGIIDTGRGDYVNAYTDFRNALHIAPNSAKTHNNLAKLYVSEKWMGSAEKEFQAALRIDPTNHDANYNLGMLLITGGRPAEAIPHLARIRPHDAQVRMALIRANLENKSTAEALRLTAALSHENENDGQLHLSLGVLLAEGGQFKAAEVEIQKAEVLNPGTFEIAFDLGQCYLRDRQYSQAEAPLNRALRLKPDSAQALYLLAEVYKAESRPLDALDLLVRARKIAPDDPDIVLLMAQISISQKYFEDAIPLLQQGLQNAPQRTDLRSALGESYFKSDNVDKAIEEFNKVIAAGPNARAYSFLGLSHIDLGRFDEAKQNFQNGLKLEPHNNFCLFNLGYIAERQGNSAEAETIFLKVLAADPDFPDALLELANLRIGAKQFSEAAGLLRRYIHSSRNPATGYYKLAMVERSLHQPEAAAKDLAEFQALSKTAPADSYLFEDLFDYLGRRSQLAGAARDEMDLANLVEENAKRPGQSEILYLLAASQLKSGNIADAAHTIEQLDKVASGDYRTLTGTGVLLARYRMYDDAIQHFQAALALSPGTDDVRFDLANAYFRKGLYPQTLDSIQQISEAARREESYLALLGDTYAHMGEFTRAGEIFRGAIARNPDNDQDYLSLAMLELRNDRIAEAKQVLLQGQSRLPASGKILWGLGLVSALEGNSAEAATQFERAVDMLPEWPGSYSTLGVFYFETGQVDKAREVLERFRNSNANSALNLDKIEEVLSQTPAAAPNANVSLDAADRVRLLQFALTLAERTL